MMPNSLKPWLLALGLFAVTGLQAEVDERYTFASETDRKRFEVLIEELRCPKCQNQNIADSDASISEDLRVEIIRLMNEGKSDDEIREYFVNRYGEYILYMPRKSGKTLFVWLVPIGFAVLGLLGAVLVVRRNKAAPVAEKAQAEVAQAEQQEQTETDHERVQRLLEQDSAEEETK